MEKRKTQTCSTQECQTNGVKSMKTIQPPGHFRDGYKPIPKPRTNRPLQMQNARRLPEPKRPPAPPPIKEHKSSILPPLQFRDDEEPTSITDRSSSEIKDLSRALKGHAKLYEVEIQDNLNPLKHFTKTEVLVESHLKDLLKTMKGFKFTETQEVAFKKGEYDPKTGESEYIYKTAYFNSKVKTITNANEIGSELSISQQEILNTIDIWVSESSRWTIDKIDSNYISIVVYQPLHGSSYVDLPDELKNSTKGLINIKNKDDECFRWCHIRHLNPQKRILRELKRLTNNILKSWMIQTLYFQYRKNSKRKLRNTTALESTYLVMKMNNHTRFTFLKRRSKTK